MRFDPGPPFASRVQALPLLGLGISTEFQAQAQGGLDPMELCRLHPGLVDFLEVGADLERGFDIDTLAWVASGRPTTYHFLDVNLEQAEDLDAAWVAKTRSRAHEIGAAWLCGDAGVWHVGARDRGHGTLMPPILELDVAMEMGKNVRRLRESTGMEVLPENPPAQAFVGSMHLLDFFGEVCSQADSGMLLDVAHLAIYQQVMGYDPLSGLERFPMDRIVEVHVAGGSPFEEQGRTFVDDSHDCGVMESTWKILEHVLARAVRLRAIVFECERNRIPEVVPTFQRIRDAWDAAGAGR